ncbi:MAG: phosphoribosylanthranilate isomerase [Melioribacteraceae bacterium]|nr:phosphoribosylanthranilate isomerase [Melioribacteraceae bacterium]
MRVKICGITNLGDAKLAAEKGADAIGFIFYRHSKRFIAPNDARLIIKKLPAFLVKVGVFVDEGFDEVNSTADKIGLNAVQLHGNETTEYADKISLPVIKAFRVEDGFNFSLLEEFHDCSHLLDGFDKNELGGTGKSFNWDNIPVNLRSKLIIAGGISVDNLEYIITKIKPEAIDLSSSIEDSPGKKNPYKLNELMNMFNSLRGR